MKCLGDAGMPRKGFQIMFLKTNFVRYKLESLQNKHLCGWVQLQIIVLKSSIQENSITCWETGVMSVHVFYILSIAQITAHTNTYERRTCTHTETVHIRPQQAFSYITRERDTHIWRWGQAAEQREEAHRPDSVNPPVSRNDHYAEALVL